MQVEWKGVWKIGVWTNISFYFGNDTRYGHSYNGRRIWTCTQSIKMCYFQWPRTHHKTVRIICARNCEKLSKFVECTAKILSVPFFPWHGVPKEHATTSSTVSWTRIVRLQNFWHLTYLVLLAC